jgi:Bacteriophage head to tail connecting protein
VSEAYRRYADARIAGLRSVRQSWLTHWAQLADYILPRRYQWLVAPNNQNRGSPINQRILDSTGTLAARVLSSGMMNGITSPTRPWFRLRIEGFEEDYEVLGWLSDCEKRMMTIFQESNFYQSMATMFFDLVVFGSACIIIYENYDDVIHCFNPCLGEFYFDLNNKMEVSTIGREFTMTYCQLVEEFGEEKVSEEVRRGYEDGGRKNHEKLVGHLIERNNSDFDLVPRQFPFREVYWEVGSPNDTLLRARGFHDWPCMAQRWDVQSNDAYGRSPGMDALGDIKQLQQETLRKGQAIDKMVNPPMLLDIQLKNSPMSLLPGGSTYISGLSREREGARPVYTVMPPIAEMMQDIREVQQRIKITFHNDLFTGITDLQTVRTATEIDARREEKLVLLGPVLERILSSREGLGSAIDRVWGIMWRGRLLPPPPQSLAGQATHIQVDYISMLAMAQKGIATAAIEKLWGFAGNIAAVKPAILDKLDPDQTIDEYASALGVPPKIVIGDEAVKEMRQQQADQANAQQLAQAVPPAADAAKTLSETDVGGGINALQMMLGTGGGSPG